MQSRFDPERFRAPPPPLHDRTFDELPLPVLLTSEQERLMRTEMEAVGVGVSLARKLAHTPRRSFAFALDKNPSASLQEQPDAGPVHELLGYDAILHANAGYMEAALFSCRAAFTAACAIGDVPSYPA